MITSISLPFCFHCTFLSDPNRAILVLLVVCMSFNTILFLGYRGMIAYILFPFFVKNTSFTAYPGSGSTVCFKIASPLTFSISMKCYAWKNSAALSGLATGRPLHTSRESRWSTQENSIRKNTNRNSQPKRQGFKWRKPRWIKRN